MQKVTRTRPTSKSYNYDPECFNWLRQYLEQGYKVVMCNKIGNDLEYILEKEDE